MVLEGWEEDIVSSRKFEDYYQALKYYKQKWLELNEHFPSYKSRSDLMTIFWDTKEQEWCEDCSEDVQFFHSIVLLEDEHKIPKSKLRPGYEKGKRQSQTPFLSIYTRFKRGRPCHKRNAEDFFRAI